MGGSPAISAPRAHHISQETNVPAPGDLLHWRFASFPEPPVTDILPLRTNGLGGTSMQAAPPDVSSRLSRKRLATMRQSPAGRGFLLLAGTTAAFGFSMAAQQNIVSNFFEN